MMICYLMMMYDTSHLPNSPPIYHQVMIDLLSASSQNFDNDLVRHNLVVFRNGENALQVLPPLLDVIPEGEEMDADMCCECD